jgi:CRP-like cAMP-binding protein
MDQSQAREILSRYVKDSFGKIVELREVSVVRRASGRAWMGELYCVTRGGEVKVSKLELSDEGAITGGFDVDDLIVALRGLEVEGGRISMARAEPDAAPGAEDDFSGLDPDAGELAADPAPAGEDIDSLFDDLEQADLRSRIARLTSSLSRNDLLAARELLPQLLTTAEGRGNVLLEMGELELRLGELDLAVNYFEAAAREFADGADIEALGRVAERTYAVVGGDSYARSSVKALFDHARSSLKPLDKLRGAPIFAGLPVEEMFDLEGEAQEMFVRQGEDVLKEGDPAESAFVVRSGILSVRLEAPDGSSRVVRCSYPGAFVGETSVLGKPGATCTATVRAECATSLWRFDGARVRKLCASSPEVRARIESARVLHHLDSFLSMNEVTLSLDTRVRDRLLGSIETIRGAAPGEVLSRAGAVPQAVYLIAEGSVEYRRPGQEPRIYTADSFVGLTDTLHGLALEGDFVAGAGCRLVCFEAGALRALAMDAPPEVVAVLERLE